MTRTCQLKPPFPKYQLCEITGSSDIEREIARWRINYIGNTCGEERTS